MHAFVLASRPGPAVPAPNNRSHSPSHSIDERGLNPLAAINSSN